MIQVMPNSRVEPTVVPHRHRRSFDSNRRSEKLVFYLFFEEAEASTTVDSLSPESVPVASPTLCSTAVLH